MPDILYAAFLAANLHHAAALKAIEAAASERKPALVAAEATRYKLEMATLGCSSVPPCGMGGPDDPARCSLMSVGDRRLVPTGAVVDLIGVSWVAQGRETFRDDGRGAILAADDSVSLAAQAGERGWFDPPRKIRAEFCGLRRFGKGEAIGLAFDFRADGMTDTKGLDWSIITQIHQADIHYADGSFVEASPVLSIGLDTGQAGDILQVSGETADSPMREPELDTVGRQKVGLDGPLWKKHFAPLRVLGHSRPLDRGGWHHVEFRVVDGHGGLGSVAVKVDGATIVDRTSLPTGYSYVDDLAATPYAGGPQDPRSYVKFGIYGGLFSGDALPPPRLVSLHFKNVALIAP